MVTQFKIFLLIIALLCPNIIFAHKVSLEDKSLEEIVNNRMALMQKIKGMSSQISKLLQSDDYDTIIELNNTLLKSAKEFKGAFPEDTQYKTASDEIWNNRDLFNEYIDKFINDIEMIGMSIELEDNEMFNGSFKEMAANCGSCHKKFKN
jgi:cytochrome c556